MADKTPAWREVYGRILDELTSRHTTHWAAVDWLNQFGHDPNRDKYPESFKGKIDATVFGSYDTPGWTANDTYGLGVQPDPIEAKGMLFFKGWFTMLMAAAEYVSGGDVRLSWDNPARPWRMAGVADTSQEWTLTRMARHLEGQFNANDGAGLH